MKDPTVFDTEINQAVKNSKVPKQDREDLKQEIYLALLKTNVKTKADIRSVVASIPKSQIETEPLGDYPVDTFSGLDQKLDLEKALKTLTRKERKLLTLLTNSDLCGTLDLGIAAKKFKTSESGLLEDLGAIIQKLRKKLS